MTSENKQPAFSFLCLVAAPRLVERAIKLLEEAHVPIQYQSHAQGTASSEMMDMLGLDGVDKNILMSMAPKGFADEMLKKLRKKLHLGMPNTGIAFTIAMPSGSGHIIQMIEKLEPEEKRRLLERNDGDMTDNDYSMIMAIVNQGFSEDVMNAARPMGASGGTVFHSRRVGNEQAMKFWKISVQEEREVVIILAKKEDKLAIMQEIGKKCGMHSQAQGIVMSLPVDNVMGLE